jgi:hypothetical protein
MPPDSYELIKYLRPVKSTKAVYELSQQGNGGHTFSFLLKFWSEFADEAKVIKIEL